MPSFLTLRLADGRSCPVHIGAGVLDELARVWRPEWREAALIGDARVLELHGDAVLARLRPLATRVEVLSFPPGEHAKTRATKERLEDALLAFGFSRGCCVVGLGGGVSLDLAGFVAATYLRGVAHVNVPTSLLAQVDAAIGGKTGVNTPHGKNLVGAFHQPAAVLIDPALLSTLPADEWGNGLAELVKHAVIADAELLRELAARATSLREPVSLDERLLRRGVEIKIEIVGADEREAGRRSVLNFGHTFGHAIEHALDHEIAHGRAVAMGMVLEAGVACELCGLPPSELELLRRCLADLHLPTSPPPIDFSRLAPFLGADKKRRDGELRLALPARLGVMAAPESGYTVPVERERLERVWRAAIEVGNG